jgi:hypothetical protein
MLPLVRLLSIRLHGGEPVEGCYLEAVDAATGEVVRHKAGGVPVEGCYLEAIDAVTGEVVNHEASGVPVEGCYLEAVDAATGEVVKHEAGGVSLQTQVSDKAAVGQDDQLVSYTLKYTL